MQHIQSINEFFWNKSEADKIAIEYITRLEKVKDYNPYNITLEGQYQNDAGMYTIYIVNFDDTPIRVAYAKINSGYDIPEGADSRFIYRLWAIVEGEKERVNCKRKYSKKLFYIIDKLYNNKGIYNITQNINPAADLL